MQRFGGAHLRVIAPMDNTGFFEEMALRWRAIGKTVFDLTGPRFESQTSCSRDEGVTAQPTVKVFTKANWNDLPRPLYNCNLGVLKLAKIYQLEVAKIMFSVNTKKILLL